MCVCYAKKYDFIEIIFVWQNEEKLSLQRCPSDLSLKITTINNSSQAFTQDNSFLLIREPQHLVRTQRSINT